jgi:hypothetical protein
MAWYYWYLIIAGLLVYICAGWPQYKWYSDYFYANHPMSHSANYRETDLYLPGAFILAVWPLIWLGRKIQSRFSAWRKQRSGKNPASGPVR